MGAFRHSTLILAVYIEMATDAGWESWLGHVCLYGCFLPLRALVRLGGTSARLRASVAKALELLPAVVIEGSAKLDAATATRILETAGGLRTTHVSLEGCSKFRPHDILPIADLLARPRYPSLEVLDVSSCPPLVRLCVVWLTIKEGLRRRAIDRDSAEAAADTVEWGRALELAQSHDPHRAVGRLVLGDTDHPFPRGPTIADLHRAARGGVLPLLDFLLALTIPAGDGAWRRLGANDKARNGDRPLHAACRTPGNTGAVRRLLEAQAGVNGLGFNKETPLHCVCDKTGDTEMLRPLLQHGAEVDAKDRDKDTSLHRALRLRDASVRRCAVRELLSHGATINVPNARRELPLHVACELGDLALVDDLLERGADLESSSVFAPQGLQMRHGSRPLHVASRFGHLDVVRALLNKGALVNSADELGWTALSQARTKECRDRLVAAGASLARIGWTNARPTCG